MDVRVGGGRIFKRVEGGLEVGEGRFWNLNLL